MQSNTLYIINGRLINWQVDFCPEMTRNNGFTMPSAINGITLKFGKEYIRSKLEHELFDKLRLERTEEVKELLDKIFE